MPFAVARNFRPGHELNPSDVIGRASTKKKAKAKAKRIARSGQKVYAIDTRPEPQVNKKAESMGTMTRARTRVVGAYNE